MKFTERIRRLITDALAVWREAGASRPFTRRGMTEGDLFEEYKHSQESGDQESKAYKRPPAAKQPPSG